LSKAAEHRRTPKALRAKLQVSRICFFAKLSACRSLAKAGVRTRPRVAFTCAGHTSILTIHKSPFTILFSQRGCSSMVERQLPKLHTRVRFPSPAFLPMKKGLEKAPLNPKVRTKSQKTSSDFRLCPPNCAMPKSKRKSKKQQNREKRDFAETASAVFQQAMGIKQPRARHPAQRHSRSGRSR
jgi:hypothetical protein